MARRKHHAKKRHHTKRRRHSAMHGIGGTLTSALYLVGGGVIAQYIGNVVSPMLPSSMSAGTKNIVNGAVPIVGGILTQKMIKGDVGAKLAAGMITVGGINLVKATGIISGVGANYYGNMPVRNIAGTQLASKGTYIAGVQKSVQKSAMLEHC